MKTPPGTRARIDRHRRKLLRAVWGDVAPPCGGPTTCAWNRPGRPIPSENGLAGPPSPAMTCECREGIPCSCRRKFVAMVLKDAERRYGLAVGGLVAGALADVAEAIHLGEEEKVRSARLTLIRLLVDAEVKVRNVECRERQVESEVRRRDAPDPFLASLIPGGTP